VIIGAFDNIGKAAAAYGELPKKLGPTIDRLPAMAAKIDRAAGSVDAVATSANKVFVKLQAPDGPLDRINSAVGSLQGVTTSLEMKTLPQLNTAADEATTTLRSVRRAANALTDRPQSILFGGPNAQPGPGEPGFVPPAK
jgi:phospholipid/cholesterol/gamma-HCH transport system substrate-binding protein